MLKFKGSDSYNFIDVLNISNNIPGNIQRDLIMRLPELGIKEEVLHIISG